MTLTKEQIAIIDACLDPKTKLLLVEAVSGAGKTATLIEIAKALNPTSGRYLAYNKAIATEAQEKFSGTKIQCGTIHSMAYQATVRSYGLKVGFFKPRDIGKDYHYNARIEIAGVIEDFCLSPDLSIEDYFTHYEIQYEEPDEVERGVKEYLDKMTTGAIPCTHSFYLKFYHILLANGEITPPEVDILMLDEFGDVTGLTLEIFKLLPAKLKVAVGDSMQTIYRFNKTINGFKELEGQGTALKLSQSFRVSTDIAKRIEHFCHVYMNNPNIVFKGMIYPAKNIIQSHAYIARTNSTLIGRMIELESMSIPYSLTRSVRVMFSLLLTIMNLKEKMIVHDQQYKFLEKDAEKYFSKTSLQQQYSTLSRYIQFKYQDDTSIMGAFRLLQEHSYSEVYSVYEAAKQHEKSKQHHMLVLTTAHSSKGLEFDKVTIMSDMNNSLDNVSEALSNIKQEGTEFEIEEAQNKYEDMVKLYYVAVSRAKFVLENATHLVNLNE